MAETRARIQKQLEKSAVAGSIVRTDVNNEQEYVQPGSNGQVLTIVAGVPTWANSVAGFAGFSITDTVTTEAIASGDTITFAANNLLDVAISATDTVTYGIDTTGATAGQVITFVGGSPVWANAQFNNEFEAFANQAAFPVTGSNDTIYYSTADNKFYIWNGTSYVEVPTALSYSLSMTDGVTTQTLVSGDTINFTGINGTKVTVSATDKVTVDAGIETEDVFVGLTTGSTVTLSTLPSTQRVVEVYRNGLRQIRGLSEDYTISGTTITFNTPFGISGGAAGSEQVVVRYWMS